MPFMAAAHEELFMSKTVELHIIAEGLDVFEQVPEHMALWIISVALNQIMNTTGFDPVLAYVMLHGG